LILAADVVVKKVPVEGYMGGRVFLLLLLLLLLFLFLEESVVDDDGVVKGSCCRDDVGLPSIESVRRVV
jgi:hypothetical protein